MNPINILIGANGAGKSNFISLFTFLRNLSEGKCRPTLRNKVLQTRSSTLGPKNTPKITIEIEIGSNGYHVEFVHGETNDTLVLIRILHRLFIAQNMAN